MPNALKRPVSAMATCCEAYKTHRARSERSQLPLSSWPSLIPPRKAVSTPTDLATEQLRHLVLDDLQETVHQVEWEYFQRAILPPRPKRFKTKAVIDTLVANKTLTKVQDQLCWTQFAQCPPKLRTDDEDKVFSKLPNVFSAIRRASGSSATQGTEFVCNPRTVPISSTRDSNSKPDGYFLLNEAPVDRKHPRWIDVVVPAEFKKDDSESEMNQNATQILWSLTHTMREDARRRFVIGFTIENTRMRLWFVSRSDVLVSYPINFITDIEKVIDFVLRMSFSSKENLGFDHTIKRLSTLDREGSPQYEIRVARKWYRTQRLISNIGAEAIRGGGTRVWEVRKLDKNGQEIGPALVLKDSWVDADRDREAAILREIRRSSANASDSAVLDTYLLHVENSWDVRNYCKKTDDTRTTILREPLPSMKHTIDVKKCPKQGKPTKANMPPRGGPVNAPEGQNSLSVYAAKVHHRVVFKEVGKTIMEAENLGNAFRALWEVVLVLRTMHRCGWVHRDISCGNVLIVNGRGVLADVEYAKHQSDDRSHNVRTGTAYFMAVEVDLHRYLYDTEKASESAIASLNDERFKDDEAEAMRMVEWSLKNKADSWDSSDEEDTEQDDTLPVGAMAFRHNPIHDMESLFWLALYIVLCSDRSKWDESLGEGEWARYSLARRKLAAKLFNDIGTRRDAMSHSTSFRAGLEPLHPLLRAICTKLDKYREELVSLYKAAEAAQARAMAELARQLQDAGTSAVADRIVPEAVPYNVAVKSDFYTVASNTFNSLRRSKVYRPSATKHISFKSRTSLLSDQQRDMVTLLEAAETPSHMHTIAEEEEGKGEEPPRKTRRLDGPSPEEVEAARSRNKELQHPRMNRSTISAVNDVKYF